MSRKRVEREVRAAHRRTKKDRQQQESGDFDDFLSLNNQLGTLGLSLKQIPGDGNCLFRALGDQLDGSAQDHMQHRLSVVQFMRQHRDDFEPFVEDDISFESHLGSLAEEGCFGGNDSIVAFARLHLATVVIHQLNKPLWQIHGGRNGSPGSQELHISYHNGDHYNSVRRIGDLQGQGPPQRIRLCLENSPGEKRREEQRKGGGGRRESLSRGGGRRECDNYRGSPSSSPDSGQESDYENCPGETRMDKLASEVSRMSGVEVSREVFDALELNRYCVTAAVDYLLTDITARARGSLWASNGTGSRILGREGGPSPARTAQDKLAGIQAKLQNKNISNKRRKELKKSKSKIAGEERRKGEREEEEEAELVISNIQSLTI